MGLGGGKICHEGGGVGGLGVFNNSKRFKSIAVCRQITCVYLSHWLSG